MFNEKERGEVGTDFLVEKGAGGGVDAVDDVGMDISSLNGSVWSPARSAAALNWRVGWRVRTLSDEHGRRSRT